jgi:hypothetical protein
MREYQRRSAKREAYTREHWGGFGVVLARLIEEPASTRAWKQGALGEVKTAGRLSRHLHDHGAWLLHDRRIPGHGTANIDHLAIGPGGVTVIDTKTQKGKVRVTRVGGLFSPRRSVLQVGGRDRTGLVDGVERQIGYVRDAIETLGNDPSGPIDVRGALCSPDIDGLPLRQLRVRDVVVDGPKPNAKLARRDGPLDPSAIERLWTHLAQRFPPA